MSSSLMSKGICIAWAGLGVVIDNIIENGNKITMYISVPKDTIAAQSISATGNKMCGPYLANRLRTTLNEITGVENVVMFKIRDEIWTDEKRREAEERVKQYVL